MNIIIEIPDRFTAAIEALAESNLTLARAIEQRAAAMAHGVTLRENIAPEPRPDPDPARDEIPTAATSPFISERKQRRSDERDALMRAEWPAGVNARGILERFNALPGSPVNVTQLGILASQMGLKRPADFDYMRAPMTLAEALRKATPKPAAAPPTPPPNRMDVIRQVAASLPQKPPPMPRPPMPEVIRMDADQLRRWAASRGIVLHGSITEENIAVCNARAQAINHPRIEFVPRRP